MSMSVFYCEIQSFDYIISLCLAYYTHISSSSVIFIISIILLLLITIQCHCQEVKLQIKGHKKIPKASNIAGYVILMINSLITFHTEERQNQYVHFKLYTVCDCVKTNHT